MAIDNFEGKQIVVLEKVEDEIFEEKVENYFVTLFSFVQFFNEFFTLGVLQFQRFESYEKGFFVFFRVFKVEIK